MRRIGLLLLLFLLGGLWVLPAHADEFDLPGLQADSDAYARSLEARNPAGSTPQMRRQAETRIADALKRNDWNAVAAALEARIAAGEATSDQWLALARAELRKVPPDPSRALQAAWRNFTASDTGKPEIPALLVMADALKALNRPEQQLQALEAVVERAPDDAAYRKMLAEAQRAAGLLVRGIRTEVEADPPRACLSFSTPPARRDDFHPQDWIRLDPPVPQAAVTREGDQICITGLPLGQTTRAILRAGMPGEGGISLTRETSVKLAMGNRAPRIVFDQRLFVLPRGQTPRITLATVNLSAVKLKLVRISERNIVPWVRDNTLGEALDRYTAGEMSDSVGNVVWEGSAPIPRWQMNKIARTALPVPDAFKEPGLYALLVSPGDGTPDRSAFAVQMILRTDLAPTVWRGSDGLTVQMRGYSDAEPRAGVKVDLVARNNDVLASAITDADGVARFAAPLTHGEGPMAPVAIHAWAQSGTAGQATDFVALDLNAAAFDLSDRGVTGVPSTGPLDTFVWLDRGIYRPGETVQVMALLRDSASNPVDIPAHVKVLRPNGQVFLETVPQRGGDASIHLPVKLSLGAAAGTWRIELRADPKAEPIGTENFQVEAFVPDRMAVDLGPAKGPIIPGQPYALPVDARFLYGAPAANLSGKATLRLEVDPHPFPALQDYTVGLQDEQFAPDASDVEIADTDDKGHTSVPIDLSRAPDTTHGVQAVVDVSINDPSGRAARASATVKVRPEGNLIGIHPLFDGAIDANTEAGFDIIAVDADGKPATVKAKLRLVRERPNWRLVMRGQLARYETVWQDEPLETQDVTLTAGTPWHYAKRLGFGRYRLEVREANGLAATSVRFRSGWVASESPDVPDKVDVSAAKRLYAPGDTARIHIAAPFGGEATLLALTDRVNSLRDIQVPAGGTDVDVKVDPAWGAGAYIAVHVFAPGAPDSRPRRAIGLVWLGIDPKPRTIPLTIAAAPKYLPRAKALIPVHATPGAWITLAAVDEGVLRLTDFATPDPIRHFFGQRRLGLDIRDDWGRLIPPAEGEATALHQGGGEGGEALPEIPQKVVALFTPPVQAGSDGIAQIPLDLPDFNGQVRLMAVSWQGNRIGSAQTDIYVRDALIAEPLLPRFLAPGDEARFPVMLQNLELPAGQAAATISVDGPLAIAGPARLTADLAVGAQAVPFTTLRATGAGRGVIHLDVTGPGGFHIRRETAILVRPARSATTLVASAELPANGEAKLDPPIGQFLPGTWAAQASFGGAVRYDAAALVRALEDYPFSCLEQATSRGFPLAFLSGSTMAEADRASRLQQAVITVLDHQRYDGGFALWGANGEVEPWLSAYATEFLLRARNAGTTVPDAALNDALKYLADQAQQNGAAPDYLAEQAYRLYVLALSGQPRAGAERVLFEKLDSLPTPLAKAQLGAALARTNDRLHAEAAFAAALAAPARHRWAVDYGTALRDQAAMAVLLKESGLLENRLGKLVAAMPGADLKPDLLSTQEQAWAIAAAAALGRGMQPAQVALDGKDQPPAPLVAVSLTGPAVARNMTDRPVWQSVSVTGVPKDAPPASRSQMRVSRYFFTTDGKPLDLDHLTQNTVFVLVLEGKAEDGQGHRALVVQGLPAGWEIARRFGGGKVPGMDWLGELSETEAQPATDDRYAAVIPLTTDQPNFRVAVQLRAVKPGNFEIPGAELSDMYRPGVFARQAANRITIQPAP